MAGQKAQDEARAERLAAELRANLKKRKARVRALKTPDHEMGDPAEISKSETPE